MKKLKTKKNVTVEYEISGPNTDYFGEERWDSITPLRRDIWNTFDSLKGIEVTKVTTVKEIVDPSILNAVSFKEFKSDQESDE